MLPIKIITFSIMCASMISVKCLNSVTVDKPGDDDKAFVLLNDIESNKRNDEQLKFIYQNYSRVHRNLDNGVIYGDSSSKCGGTFKSVQTTIQSPDYPDEYQPNTYCEYVFKSPFVCKNEFHIQFLFFSLESSKNCVKDYLKIGKNETLCGKVIGIMKYKAMDGVLKILFVTDDTTEGQGFNLLVTRLPCSDDEYSTTFPIYDKRTVQNDEWDISGIEFTTTFDEESTTENETVGLRIGDETTKSIVDKEARKPVLTLQTPVDDSFEGKHNKGYQFSYLGANGNGYLPPPSTGANDNGYLPPPSTDIHTTHTNCYPVNGGQFPNVNGGQYPTINGGQYPNVNGGQYPNVNGGQYPNVNGGQYPTVNGQNPTVNGGQYPTVNGQYPTVNGGQFPYNGQYPVGGGQFPTFVFPTNNGYPSTPFYPSTTVFNTHNSPPLNTYPYPNYPSLNGYLPPTNNYPSSNGYLPPSNGYLPQNPNQFPYPPANHPTFSTNNDYPTNSFYPHTQPPGSANPNIEETTTPTRDIVQAQTFPSAIPQCCARQFNQQRFYVASSNFPTANSQNVDCLHYINRNNPGVCRIRIEFKFFFFGNYHPQLGCVDNFIEIDGQRICGCLSGTRYISQWGIGSKIIRVRSRPGAAQGVRGFLLDVIQEQCPYRISRNSSPGGNQTNWDRSDAVLQRAVTQTNSSSLTTYYYYAEGNEDEKPKVRQETNAEFEQRAEGPNARFLFPPTGQQNKCVFSYLHWLQLVADPLWLVKPSCRR